MTMDFSCKTPNTTLPIVQLTEEDILCFALDPVEMGTWCFISDGTFKGFYETRKECEDRVAQLLAD